MQAMNVSNDTETTFVPAQTLREMTITKEALAANQKANVLNSLMESMVRVATEQGSNVYLANLNPQFDPALLAQITNELKTLGYVVATEAKTDEKLGPFIQIVINW